MGTPLKTPKNGNQCQTFTQRKKNFLLYIDPKGKGSFGEPEIFHLDVRGNILKNIRIITPSFVTKNKRFDIVVRFEDEYGNLTSNAPEKTLIELSYENLRENLNWKLFVPETGFLTLPNLYFNEEGDYRICLKNLSSKELFYSSPMKCFSEEEISLLWGLFHGESEKVDSLENIDSALRYFRDDRSLGFYASSPFDAENETTNDEFKALSHQIAEFNEDDRFSTFLGFQWVGTPSEEGVRDIIYLKDQKPLLRKKDMKTNSLKKIYKTFQPKEMISIPTFTMSENSYNFADFSYEFERVAEIYNAWGSSECSPKEGNSCPPSPIGKTKNLEGSLQKALLENCRFGFVAGGLDDRGIYSSFYDNDQEQYHPGLTAIITKTHSREGVFEALYNRSCYATTGKRIILGFHIATQPMGSELNTQTKPGLVYNRYITGYVSGTAKIQKIEILRNGKIFQTFEPKQDRFSFEFDDSEPLSKITIQPNGEKPPFVFYYIRVFQEDGHIAWGSPIWIDDLSQKEKPVKKPTPKIPENTQKKKVKKG
jgi:hypothetical protein